MTSTHTRSLIVHQKKANHCSLEISSICIHKDTCGIISGLPVVSQYRIVVTVIWSSKSGRVLIKNRRCDLAAHECHGREGILIALVQSSVRRSRDRAHVGRHVVSSRSKSQLAGRIQSLRWSTSDLERTRSDHSFRHIDGFLGCRIVVPRSLLPRERTRRQSYNILVESNRVRGEDRRRYFRCRRGFRHRLDLSLELIELALQRRFGLVHVLDLGHVLI